MRDNIPEWFSGESVLGFLLVILVVYFASTLLLIVSRWSLGLPLFSSRRESRTTSAEKDEKSQRARTRVLHNQGAKDSQIRLNRGEKNMGSGRLLRRRGGHNAEVKRNGFRPTRSDYYGDEGGIRGAEERRREHQHHRGRTRTTTRGPQEHSPRTTMRVDSSGDAEEAARGGWGEGRGQPQLEPKPGKEKMISNDPYLPSPIREIPDLVHNSQWVEAAGALRAARDIVNMRKKEATRVGPTHDREEDTHTRMMVQSLRQWEEEHAAEVLEIEVKARKSEQAINAFTDDDGWLLVSERDDGTKIHYRTVEGGHVAVRICGVVHAPIERGVAVWHEVDYYTSWFPGCERSEEIESMSDTDKVLILRMGHLPGLKTEFYVRSLS